MRSLWRQGLQGVRHGLEAVAVPELLPARGVPARAGAPGEVSLVRELPWARPRSGFTLLFEALVVAMAA